MSYHDRIMNITRIAVQADGWKGEVAWKEGHKSARHEAAEIALKADAEIVELTAERDRLKSYEEAIRNRHNGYDPEARRVMPTLKEPASPEAALDELQEEQDGLENYHIEACLKAEADNAVLLEALQAMVVMSDRGPQPRKLDEALCWSANDKKARAMADTALGKDHPGSVLLAELEAARERLKGLDNVLDDIPGR